MAEVKISVSLNEYTIDIIDNVAGRMWPEFLGNRSALYRKIVADWHRLRFENGSGRTARIEQLEQRMVLVERRLGIGTDEHDTDHG